MVAHLSPRLIMPIGLRYSLRVIDYGMLLYWSMSSLSALGIIRLPGRYMYAGFGDPIMAAWNWSFAPLDILFAITGIYSIHLANKGDEKWHPAAVVSLTLTFCAGLMAIAFWTMIGFFDPWWWIPNLALMIVPLFWLARLFARQRVVR